MHNQPSTLPLSPPSISQNQTDNDHIENTIDFDLEVMRSISMPESTLSPVAVAVAVATLHNNFNTHHINMSLQTTPTKASSTTKPIIPPTTASKRTRMRRIRRNLYDPCCVGVNSGDGFGEGDKARLLPLRLPLPSLSSPPSGNRERSRSAGYGMKMKTYKGPVALPRLEKQKHTHGNSNQKEEKSSKFWNSKIQMNSKNDFSNYFETCNEYRKMATVAVAPASGTPSNFNRRRAFSSGPLIGSTILVGTPSRESLDCNYNVSDDDTTSTISSMDETDHPPPIHSVVDEKKSQLQLQSQSQSLSQSQQQTQQQTPSADLTVSISHPRTSRARTAPNLSSTFPTITMATCNKANTKQSHLDRSPSFLQLPCMFLGLSSRRRVSAPAAVPVTVTVTVDQGGNTTLPQTPHCGLEIDMDMDMDMDMDIEANVGCTTTSSSTTMDPRSQSFTRRIIQIISVISFSIILLAMLNASSSSSFERHERPTRIKKDLDSIRTVKNFQGEWGLTFTDTVEERNPLEQVIQEDSIRKKRQPKLSEANSLATQHLSSNLDTGIAPSRNQQFVLTDDEIEKKTASLKDASLQHSGVSDGSGRWSFLVVLLSWMSVVMFVLRAIYGEKCHFCKRRKRRTRGHCHSR